MNLRTAIVFVAGVVPLSVLAPGAAQTSSLPAATPRVRFLPGSTVKLEQLIGDEDRQRHQPTRSRTLERYGVEGTDLGNSFDHAGRVYFLFGDTVGTVGRALDSIATTDARDPDAGVRMDFLTTQEPVGRRGAGRGRAVASGATRYLTIDPPGISMGAFEVPAAGLSLNGQMYLVVTTNHAEDRSTDRSVLTKFTLPSTFEPLRTISQLPAGHFLKMSMHAQPAALTGLPPGGPYIFMWGTGAYRKSDAYLAIVPALRFESGQGTRYFSGMGPSGPTWSEREADATPIVRNGTMGDVSVTWCQDLGLWLMTYDSRPPARQGIEFSYSSTPWGTWSEPQLIFSAERDGAFGAFIHAPRGRPPDGLAGPVIGQGRGNPDAVRGGAYAPYVVERWTKRQGADLSLYYVLSTWNPYVVVLMKTRLQIE